MNNFNPEKLVFFSFGGPNTRNDVMPFLRKVVEGKNIPDSRLEGVAEHYYHFDGKSPINDLNEIFIKNISKELENRKINLQIVKGNRNWHPFIEDTVKDLTLGKNKDILVLITSAYTSDSGRKYYFDDLQKAINITPEARNLKFQILPEFFNLEGFVESFVVEINETIEKFIRQNMNLEKTALLFSTHSIPSEDMLGEIDETADIYLKQHQAVVEEILSKINFDFKNNQKLVFQSRSGNPKQPWLEPDINDVVSEWKKERKIENIIVVPIGFTVDHMEVLWDLDTEVKNLAEELKINYFRIPTPYNNEIFINSIVDLIEENIKPNIEKKVKIVTKYKQFPNKIISGQ